MTNNIMQLIHAKRGNFFVNPLDRYTGRSLLHYGEYCDEEVALLSSILSENDIVVDGGANIGALSIPLAKKIPKGKLIAFEPQRMIFQNLAANIYANHLSNIIALPYGLDSESRTLFSSIDPNIYYQEIKHYGMNKLEENGTEPVQTKTLETVFSQLKLNTLKLLKLDIEGMEQQALLGAEKLIDQHHPYLYIENDKTQQSSDQMIDWLLNKNYRIYLHATPYYALQNFFNCPVDVGTSGSSFNLFCFYKNTVLPKDTSTYLQQLDINNGCEIKDKKQYAVQEGGEVISWRISK